MERTRIVDRICPISTNRALSIGQALCHRCVGIPVREASTPIGNSSATRGSGDGPSDPGACAGCGNQLREGQALVALDRQWHVWCLKCHSCDTVLHGEYMGKWVKTSFYSSVVFAILYVIAEKKYRISDWKIKRIIMNQYWSLSIILKSFFDRIYIIYFVIGNRKNAKFM